MDDFENKKVSKITYELANLNLVPLKGFIIELHSVNSYIIFILKIVPILLSIEHLKHL